MTTTAEDTQEHKNLMDNVDKLQSDITVSTAAADELLVKVRTQVDEETNIEILDAIQFRLNALYKILETFTGEVYMAAHWTKGRCSYLRNDKNRSAAKT
jgi:hypothetical protein